MTNRLAKTLLAATAVAALAMPAAAQARHGADDGPAHVRHAAHATTSAAHKARTRHRHHGRHHTRGADDNGVRRHGGADDGPNHT
jgi:Ni/Co efflux regulator RcnB